MPKLRMMQSSVMNLSSDEPAWIRDVHTHFALTGTYRPEDIRRILGNPKEGVEIPPSRAEEAAKPAEEKAAEKR